MRDYTEELLAHKLLTEEQYENACPVCVTCKNHITAHRYFYDINGDYVCDSYDCIDGYLKQFF